MKLCRIALRKWLGANAEGIICFISSTSAQKASIVTPLYQPSKHAISCFTRSMAPLQDLCGVRSCAVAPGLTASPMLFGSAATLKLFDPEKDTERLATPQAVAEGLMAVAMDREHYPPGTVLEVKCDLEYRIKLGSEKCSNCSTTGNSCRLRPSRRTRPRRSETRAPFRSPAYIQPLGRPNLQPVFSNIDKDETAIEGPSQSRISTQQDQNSPGLGFTDDPAPTETILNAFTWPNSTSINQEQQIVSFTRPVGSATGHKSTIQAAGYIGDTGVMQMYAPETRLTSSSPPTSSAEEDRDPYDIAPPEIQQSFLETYFEYCFTWCPVLDRDDVQNDLERSPLLVNALSLLGSQVQPPLLKHAEPTVYYDRAKSFYNNEKEPNLITCLQAIILFYWWSPRAPTVVSRDSTWWWTGIAIRQAQQLGLHRRSRLDQRGTQCASQGLRRRIWWTLFARERLTAISQGRPVMIDPEDSDLPPPSLADFPAPDLKAEIFIQWVRVCGIVGKAGKFLLRAADHPQLPFPKHIAEELTDWVETLPEHLALPFSTERAVKFNRDVHQLHLPYLAVIILLHLKPTSQPVPGDYSAPVMAASCIARIMRDFLARGGIRFLPAITCWYCGIASLALLHVRRIESLTSIVDDDIRALYAALNQLKTMWLSANIFLKGIDRLRQAYPLVETSQSPPSAPSTEAAGPDLRGVRSTEQAPSVHTERVVESVNWVQYFPFATVETSTVAGMLLIEHAGLQLQDNSWYARNLLPFQAQLDDCSDLLHPFIDVASYFPSA
ncbi:Fungal specific transcription factor domain-containing protein [Cladophialophora immunda]|nr:Fungal specific transcription factor domain-containing protein [Cladophialophora immunda]